MSQYYATNLFIPVTLQSMLFKLIIQCLFLATVASGVVKHLITLAVGHFQSHVSASSSLGEGRETDMPSNGFRSLPQFPAAVREFLGRIHTPRKFMNTLLLQREVSGVE